ncbi:transporter substrate-binding domain-containing protein [Bacillus spongiae]|uniref:Transporter substrate-binding domain-containing protein n=1 Tax=Bacillus spongiae TaxID=2683610 RepID=A0ABU8HBI7_9BACI
MKKLFVILSICFTIILSGCRSGGGDRINTDGQQTDKGKGYSSNSNTIIVGVENANYPISFIDEDGEPAGADIDLIKAIAEDQGLDIEFKPMNFNAIIPSLQTGQLDAAISMTSLGPTTAREKEVDFGDAITAARTAMISKKGSNLNNIKDLNDHHIIAVKSGSLAELVAEEVAGETGAELRRFDTTDKVLQDVENGQSHVAIESSDVLYSLLWENPNDSIQFLIGDLMGFVFEIMEDRIQDEGNGFNSVDIVNAIAVREGDKELLDIVNAGLNNIEENGKIHDIESKWHVVLSTDAWADPEWNEFKRRVNPNVASGSVSGVNE